jgi:molecular chaperone DnaK (HSP70)
MRVEIKREEFEEAISSLIARTDILLEVALEEAGVEPSGIDKVLLVGGSTRVPFVQKRLEKTFGFAPETTVNVDECVALGAALHAGLTMLRERPDAVPAGISGGLGDINLTDGCRREFPADWGISTSPMFVTIAMVLFALLLIRKQASA